MRHQYSPSKLQACLEAVKKQHPIVGDAADMEFPTVDIKALVERIVSMHEGEAASEALVLSPREINALSAYLPANVYNISNLSNICAVLRLRSTARNMQILLNNWQCHYHNKTCNLFLGLLIKHDECMQEALIKSNISADELAAWLKEKDLCDAIAMTCLHDNAHSEVKQLLEKHGIDPLKPLGEDTIRRFYLVCRADDYLREKESFLVELISSMSEDEYDQFLQNLVSVLSDNELDKMRELTRAVWERTEQIKRRQHYLSILNAQHPLNIKLQGWMNGFQMEDMFRNADNGNRRLAFWYRFRKDAVMVIHDKQRTLLKMVFPTITVIEFSDSGPMYFFYNELYESKIVRGMPMTNRNRAIADYLLHSCAGASLVRIEHRGYWESTAKTALRHYHVLGGRS